jgi:hypothetical protein
MRVFSSTSTKLPPNYHLPRTSYVQADIPHLLCSLLFLFVSLASLYHSFLYSSKFPALLDIPTKWVFHFKQNRWEWGLTLLSFVLLFCICTIAARDGEERDAGLGKRLGRDVVSFLVS